MGWIYMGHNKIVWAVFFSGKRREGPLKERERERERREREIEFETK